MKATYVLSTVVIFAALGCGGSDSKESRENTSIGGATNVGGGSFTRGGAGGSGGFSATTSVNGGTPTAGGTTTVGRSDASGGATLAVTSTAAGGVTERGGSSSSAGASTSGGAVAIGGRSSTGGTAASGGKATTGGTSTAGGTSAAGGTTAKGGATSTVIGATPPMGWNSWNTFNCNGLTEALVKAVADKFVSSGMKDAGYQYVNLDDCWMDGRDASGKVKVNASKFPSGMKSLADYVHGKGLKIGLYSTPGDEDLCRHIRGLHGRRR